MAVRAYKIVSGYRLEYTFECGQFDLANENGAGWTEIWRDCDLGARARRTLYPYASGLKGVADIDVNIAGSRLRHRKYFPSSDDSFTDTLDLSDTNSGQLPLDYCTWFEMYQNGKKIPCEAFTVNFGTAVVTINEAWRVPGAAYEILFWAAPVGGSNPGPGS